MGTRVFIADDHALMRQGIKQILSWAKDIEVVGEADNGEAAWTKTLRLSPDILLLDMNMPGMTGIEVVRKLNAAHSRTQVIMLTINDCDYYVVEMFKEGVKGYLLKGLDPQELLTAIHCVAAGRPYMCQDLQDRFACRGQVPAQENLGQVAREICREERDERLTVREMEVLHCIAKGMSNKAMAAALFVSDATVRNHLTSIYRKLNVADRTQALIYALRHRMIAEGAGGDFPLLMDEAFTEPVPEF